MDDILSGAIGSGGAEKAEKKPTVLLCEDQKELIDEFRKAFDEIFEIHICNSSEKIENAISDLQNKGSLPDVVLCDLYWPRGHIPAEKAHDIVNREIESFKGQIDVLRKEVNSNLFPEGIDHLRDIRSKFSPSALPVMMYTRAGPYILEPKQIEYIYDLGAAILIKGYDRDLTAYLVRKHIERWKLPYDVFLSYAGEDIGLARELFAKLSNKDLNVFLAQESIEAGEEWLTSIRRALRLSNVFVMLLTDNSKGKPWVNAEAGAAWSLGKKIISACRGVSVSDASVVSLVRSYQARQYDTEHDSERMVEDVSNLCRSWSR